MHKLIDILRVSKDELKEVLLKDSSYTIAGNNYILWHRDNGLPYLVAHIDTFYDATYMDKNWENRVILTDDEYYWSPTGLGADDRAGVYAVMELFNKCSVNCLFTDGEESGGIGATEVVIEQRDILKKTPYFIEIDRRGYNQAVFYHNEQASNTEFYNKVKSMFDVSIGSFSDVSIIGGELLIASVNLSAGFYNEHISGSEYLYKSHLEFTIAKVPRLIETLGNKQYKIDPTYTKQHPLYTYSQSPRVTEISPEIFAEIYVEMLEDSKYMNIHELTIEYYGLVSLSGLKKVEKYFTNKEYNRLKTLIERIEKRGSKTKYYFWEE